MAKVLTVNAFADKESAEASDWTITVMDPQLPTELHGLFASGPNPRAARKALAVVIYEAAKVNGLADGVEQIRIFMTTRKTYAVADLTEGDEQDGQPGAAAA